MILKKLKSKRDIFKVLTVLVIVFFGTFLRLWQLGYSSYWLDEGFTLMQARGIVMYGYPLLDSGVIEWKDLLIPYITALALKFSGFEYSWLLRLPAAVFGSMTIVVSYYFAHIFFSDRSLTNENSKSVYISAMLFTFFIATCYWYVAWSQQVRGYSALVFFVLLFFYFLAKHNKNGKVRFIWYAFVSIIFAVLAKKFAIILFISFLFYLLSKKMYKEFLVVIVPIVGVIVFFINSVGHILVINKQPYFYGYIKEYLFDYFGVISVMAWFGMIAILFSRPRQRILNMSIILFIINSIIIFSLFIFVLEGRYLLMITPFLFLYTVYFIKYLVSGCKYKNLGGISLTIVVVILYSVFNQGVVLIPKKHYALETGIPQPEYREVYEKIIKAGFMDDDVIISTNPLIDIIYLKQATYGIPWSLTGREGDTTYRDSRDVYSGVESLRDESRKGGFSRIGKLQKKSNVYVIIDSLAYRRMNINLRNAIVKEGDEIFRTRGRYSVIVFYFPKYEKENGAL